MKLGKRFVHSRIATGTISLLLSLYMRLVFRTSHITHLYHPDSLPYLRGERNAIFAFWHGRMMMMPTVCPPGHPMHVLISHHRDGVLISRVIGHFGQDTISGSSSRGGTEAIRNILHALKAGDNISFTPDGPRGPIHIASAGIISMAKLSGKPIVPVTFAASRVTRLTSWDRFMVARPFGRIVFCSAEPIMVERHADEEEARLKVQDALNALCETADRHVA